MNPEKIVLIAITVTAVVIGVCIFNKKSTEGFIGHGRRGWFRGPRGGWGAWGGAWPYFYDYYGWGYPYYTGVLNGSWPPYIYDSPTYQFQAYSQCRPASKDETCDTMRPVKVSLDPSGTGTPTEWKCCSKYNTY